MAPARHAPLRMLLLGGSGRLGTALHEQVPQDWTLISPPRSKLDLAQATTRDLQAWVRTSASSVVLNAAAMAWVDECEEQPEAAEQINALAPGRLATACALEAVPLLHISTDYVFGDVNSGGPAPYAENRAACPVQVYGSSKARGETAVQAAGGRASVVRVSWLTEADGGSFLAFLQEQLKRDPSRVEVLTAQRSRPTLLPGLCRWLFALSELLANGHDAPAFLHPAGGAAATRGEWADHLLKELGYHQVELIEQQGQATSPEHSLRATDQRAPRPLDSSLDGRATRSFSQQAGLPELDDWQGSPPVTD